MQLANGNIVNIMWKTDAKTRHVDCVLSGLLPGGVTFQVAVEFLVKKFTKGSTDNIPISAAKQ